MPDGKTYEIRTVADFAQVPPERLTLCLREFRAWLKLRRTVDTLNARLKDLGIDEWIVAPDAYRWIDDDLGEMTVAVKMATEAPLSA